MIYRGAFDRRTNVLKESMIFNKKSLFFVFHSILLSDSERIHVLSVSFKDCKKVYWLMISSTRLVAVMLKAYLKTMLQDRNSIMNRMRFNGWSSSPRQRSTLIEEMWVASWSWELKIMALVHRKMKKFLSMRICLILFRLSLIMRLT